MTARDTAPATATAKSLWRYADEIERKRILAIEQEARQQGRDEERERIRAALEQVRESAHAFTYCVDGDCSYVRLKDLDDILDNALLPDGIHVFATDHAAAPEQPSSCLECGGQVYHRAKCSLIPEHKDDFNAGFAAGWKAAPPATGGLDERTLADALHHAMCTVSHHDSDFRERSCYAKYPLIARSAAAYAADGEGT